MPHSTASEPMVSEVLVEQNSMLPDTPEHVPDHAKEEGKMDIIDHAWQLEDSTGEAPRMDVKLQDLFNDVTDDEHDEFSGSGVSNTKNESSPPKPPL